MDKVNEDYRAIIDKLGGAEVIKKYCDEIKAFFVDKATNVSENITQEILNNNLYGFEEAEAKFIKMMKLFQCFSNDFLEHLIQVVESGAFREQLETELQNIAHNKSGNIH